MAAPQKIETPQAPYMTGTHTIKAETLQLRGKELVLYAVVAGPVHVTDLQDSTLVLHCHQLRMHDCHRVSVAVTCPSQPIIEHCTDMVFNTPAVDFDQPTGNSPNWKQTALELDEHGRAILGGVVPEETKETQDTAKAA